jgi:hypothetical protein
MENGARESKQGHFNTNIYPKAKNLVAPSKPHSLRKRC